ncbi:MAG: glycosyltransferase family 2 protein [Pseudomonadota bacterium]
MKVTICICTFRRESLRETLKSLGAQALPQGCRIEIVVADNDETPSAEPLVAEAAAKVPHSVRYHHAPKRNISIARNACLDAVEPDTEWVAFIDDDETARANWLERLIAAAQTQSADVVFGPAVAVYPPGTPAWIKENDFHSNRPVHKGDVIETGYSSNVLMRWGHPAVRNERFLLRLGRTGGEDVEYFFRLHRMGLKLASAQDAIVYEPVEQKRLNTSWLMSRRFTMGRIYGFSAPAGGVSARIRLFAGGLIKAAYCGLRAIPAAVDRVAFARWGLRALFHLGVCHGCLSPPNKEVYGVDP